MENSAEDSESEIGVLHFDSDQRRAKFYEDMLPKPVSCNTIFDWLNFQVTGTCIVANNVCKTSSISNLFLFISCFWWKFWLLLQQKGCQSYELRRVLSSCEYLLVGTVASLVDHFLSNKLIFLFFRSANCLRRHQNRKRVNNKEPHKQLLLLLPNCQSCCTKTTTNLCDPANRELQNRIKN